MTLRLMVCYRPGAGFRHCGPSGSFPSIVQRCWFWGHLKWRIQVFRKASAGHDLPTTPNLSKWELQVMTDHFWPELHLWQQLVSHSSKCVFVTTHWPYFFVAESHAEIGGGPSVRYWTRPEEHINTGCIFAPWNHMKVDHFIAMITSGFASWFAKIPWLCRDFWKNGWFQWSVQGTIKAALISDFVFSVIRSKLLQEPRTFCCWAAFLSIRHF